ncbi:MAG: hypothetical protein U9Q40_05410 [Campylobacterota bacterium]|nr:hypothetical protein [Campylobacterota bacterium]
MQRKNNILISARSGIAMVMALSVIVIVATIMALSLTLTSTTAKKSTDLYLYEQSVLLSKSATEYALLQIAQNPPCSDVNTTFTQDNFYTIDIGVQYIYDSAAPCTTNDGSLYTTIATPEQNGSAIMDVTVSVAPDKNVSSEPIRYFRRTIQKL